MFNIYLKSMHDLGMVVSTDESVSMDEAKELAKDMLQEADASIVEFDYDSGILRGYDEDEAESMYYATFEEKADLTLQELSDWFNENQDYDDMIGDVLDGNWDNY